jgi:hypothetical protein
MKRIGMFLVESDSLVDRLRELDALDTLKGLPDGGLKEFCDLLSKCLFEGPPTPVFGSTGITGDNTIVCKFFWSDDAILSALVATQRKFLLFSSHVNSPSAYAG